MVIGINCGHTVEGPGMGAVGVIRESEHTRLVGNILMKMLTDAGVSAVNCTVDRAASQEAYLEKTVEIANQSSLDLFISIHFNAAKEHRAQGTEVYTYEGKKHSVATSICTHLEKLGFSNRGVKDGSGLYVIRRTEARAILVEVCFCDNERDVETYERAGSQDAVAGAIYEALCATVIEKQGKTENAKEKFLDRVGRAAVRDWQARRIVLPSVVVAQAIKESAWGTSELARKANALFGIKKNGWGGRIYVKDALEQNVDGSYYRVEQTQWRAYDSWEESVLDHNTYIAERSVDGGQTLRYAPVIGCTNYILAAGYLQECGYATAQGYAESLIHDYIERYKLTKFDS